MELGCGRCFPQGVGRVARGACGVRKRMLVGGEWRAGKLSGLDWAHCGPGAKVNGHRGKGAIASYAHTSPIDGTGNEGIPLYDLKKTETLVDTAMLAAVSGMASLLFTLIKLDSYLYYIMPFPLVLASLRSGLAASRKTLMATFFLMFVLLGPPRAVTYLWLYGITGITLGAMWSVPYPWWLTMPACTGAYVLGMMGYVFTASFMLHENIFQLIVYNIQSLVAQVSSFFGMQAVLSTPAIIVALVILLFMRGIMYVGFLHIGFALVLEGMGHKVGKLPQFVERALWPMGKPSTLRGQ